ncbi:MAG: FecR domain-containing protein [Bacteriovoracaceae bacterium]
MIRFLLVLLLSISFAYAQIGEIRSLTSPGAYLMRAGSRIDLATGTPLEVGDDIFTESSHVTLILFPKIQMSLVNGTELKISQHMIDEANEEEKTTSLVDLIKGLLRIQVTRDGSETVDQKINAKEVTFAVRGTEFEVSSTDDDAELDVFEGEVQVSSPYVQTFVPEIVKPNEGFRFDRKTRKFARRANRERIKNARFMQRQQMREMWKNKKAMRREQKLQNRQTRMERKEELKAERQANREERKAQRKRGH